MNNHDTFPYQELTVQTATPDENPPAAPEDFGQSGSFDEFYRKEFRPLVAYLIWKGASPDEACEHAQEAMITVYTRWADIEYPKAYVRTVAERRHLAAHVQLGRLEKAVQTLSALACSSETPQALVEFAHILKLIDELPPAQRDVMQATLDGQSPADISTETGCSSQTVRSNLRHARNALRKLLHDTPETVRQPSKTNAGNRHGSK